VRGDHLIWNSKKEKENKIFFPKKNN